MSHGPRQEGRKLADSAESAKGHSEATQSELTPRNIGSESTTLNLQTLPDGSPRVSNELRKRRIGRRNGSLGAQEFAGGQVRE